MLCLSMSISIYVYECVYVYMAHLMRVQQYTW